MNFQIPKVIHQIFFDIGKGKLPDIPRYLESHLSTKEFCKTHDIQYKLWTRQDIDGLLEEIDKQDTNEITFTKFYNEMKYDIQRIDFAKYLILYLWGGLYFDLDITILGNIDQIKHLFTLEYFFVKWNDLNHVVLPYNALLASYKSNPLFLEIINACRKDYYQKLKIQVYKTWRGRFVFQTTGHFMLNRVLQRSKVPKSKLINILHVKTKGREFISPTPLFLDTNESVWYQN